MSAQRTIGGVSQRPAYVARDFPGRCKTFPRPKEDGREPLLLAYQVNWVLDEERLKLMEKSRQIGLSWATAYRLVSTTSLTTAKFDDWVSSRDELQAKLFIDDCKSFAGILHIGATDLGQQVVDEDKHSAFVLSYANGRYTHSLSSNPNAQAGKRGRRVFDEFALHQDPRKLYAIGYPGITWGGSMEIISTHRGTANFFNDLVTEIKHKGNPKKFSLHSITLQRALEDGFLYKLQKKLSPTDERQQMDEAEYFDFIRRGCPDEETFLQEYCCVPSDDNSAFLSYELIQSCEYKPDEKWEIPQPRHWTDLQRTTHERGKLFIGVDVGRDHDLTVIWVMERLGDVMHTRAVVCMQGATFDEQEETLYAWLRLPQVRRCCIDCTGIGRQFTERAQKRFGSYKVEKVNFTAPVKEELAYPVRAAFEDRSVRIPNDPFIRADLRAVKKETTAAGNIRFTADRGKNGHSDRFWALALALHAGKRSGGDPYKAAAVAVGGFEGGVM
jgi:phage FluMu gp28-like protein